MKLAIMQPYLFPYIGYFQLIDAADMFIVYDNIKYTKKGWINRNQILQNGKAVKFSLPLSGGSDTLNIDQRALADDFNPDKLLNQIKGAYQRAPYFAQTGLLLERVLRYPERNLFKFLHHSIAATSEHLGIETEIQASSVIPADHGLKGQDRVQAICKATGADHYLNAIGGRELYTKEAFIQQGIKLQFIQSKSFHYQQFDNEFVPSLSIIDVLMFNSPETVQASISTNYKML